MYKRAITATMSALVLGGLTYGAVPEHFQQRAKELLADSIDLPACEHQVNVVYFVGQGYEPIDNYQRRISELMLYTQQFYGKEIARNGLGNRSFGLALKENGEVDILLVRGKAPHTDYTYGGGHNSCLQEIEAYFAAHPEKKRSQHTLVIMPTFHNDEYNDLNPGGVPFYGLGTNCFALDYAHFDIKHLGQPTPEGRLLTKWFGGLAHELGHGLNLPHNDGTASQNTALGTALMGAGNYTFGIKPTYMTLASCRILVNSEMCAPSGCATAFYSRTELPVIKEAAFKRTGDTLELYLETEADVVNVNSYVQDPPFQVNRDYDAIAFACNMGTNAAGNTTANVTIPLSELSALKNLPGGEMALDLLIQTSDGSRFRWRVPFDLSKVPADSSIEMGDPVLWPGY